ncbi:MAG: fold metallo-hydrolase [Acidimicrobiaceae bacterium]|nr:fold metallo-hydrolase [Acidimicrobiaceae bacterium]
MITQVSRQLGHEIVLNVHLVIGSEISVLVDSGIADMGGEILSMIDATSAGRSAVRFIVNTHSHHDHMGANGLLKAELGCIVAAPPALAHWHRDFDRHLAEFTDPADAGVVIPPVELAELRSTLDREHSVELHLGDGSEIDLGGDVLLRCIELPGHVRGEVGFLEASSGTLIIGDVLIGLDWPFFHGYVDTALMRGSLERLDQHLRSGAVLAVRPAHYPVMTAKEATAVVHRIMSTVEEIAAETEIAARSLGSFSARQMRDRLCERFGKAKDFRALAVANAHLLDLVGQGQLRALAGGRYELST